jgi:hypothetical protein
MGTAQSMHLAGEPPPRAGSMRVVILEPDPEIRDGLRRAIEGLPGFLLVGESQIWAQCEGLLKLFVPELLIARIDFAFPSLAESVCESIFPVMIGLRTPGGGGTHSRLFATLDLPLNLKSLSMMMEHARTEIYRRKLEELSALLRSYTSFSRDIPQYLSSLRVESDGGSEIPADLVMLIAADGNYVRIHTMANVHEIRDTLSGMGARLDPAQFARVHRSYVVNRNHVRSVVRKEGAALSVLLSNGMEIPVGPNYRAEVDSFETITKRLSA